MTLLDKSPQQNGSWTIPFKYDPLLTPYIIVQASINGQPPLPFVVDTGTSGLGHLLIVEPWAAKKLHLPLLASHQNQSLLGQPGQHTINCTAIKTLTLTGSDKKSNFQYQFASNNKTSMTQETYTPFEVIGLLSGLSSTYQTPPVAGILSCSLLNLPGKVCEVDFQHQTSTFVQKNKSWHIPADSAVVPLEKDQFGDYHVQASLAASQTRNFLIDTGSPTTNVQNLAALSPSEAPSVQSVYRVSVDRQRSYCTVLLPQMNLSGLAEPNIALSETPAAAAASSANLLGLNFLSRFIVTFDLADNKMYLKRRADYVQKIVPEGQSGVRVEKHGAGYIAAWVQPGSPAELAGMHTGNQIVQVDGQPLGLLPWYAAQTFLDGFQGTAADLVVRAADGKETSLRFIRAEKFIGRRHALLGVSLDWTQGYLLVSGITPGSPLDGTLKYGDDIYSINGVIVAKMTMDEAFQSLTRPDVVLQVWRASDKTWQEVHLAPLPAQTQVISEPLPVAHRYTFDGKTGWTLAP